MINPIASLVDGDLVEILAPAKSIDADFVFFAREFLENQGFRVRISPNCLGKFHYFSGTLEERRGDFQQALNDKEVKAILCARGGYGCVQFLSDLDWSGFVKNPKWIMGFSDVSVFHQQLACLAYPSIHCSMPLNFKDNSSEALTGITACLKGERTIIQVADQFEHIHGEAEGFLTGGNLSIIFSLLGTSVQPDYRERILFIEDVGEQLYHLDRIFFSLKLAGVLDDIAGLIVGGMTDMKDTEIPFGKTYKEIITSHLAYRDIPVVFDFHAGHINDNRALVFGEKVVLLVNETGAQLQYL